jgi:hypothetical protein
MQGGRQREVLLLPLHHPTFCFVSHYRVTCGLVCPQLSWL